MECPVCGEKLREIEKYGVLVDICPGCKGVWLDRGELEKIVEMAEVGGPRGSETRSEHAETPRFRPEEHYGDHGAHKRKKSGGWLGDILGGFGDD